MKRLCLTLLPVLALFFVTACQKSGDRIESDYYLKFKINGNWVTWTKAIGELAPGLADKSKTDLGVTGQSDDNKEILDISVQVDGAGIQAGTYSSDNYNLPIIYVKDGNSSVVDSYTLGSIEGRGISRYTVTITSITETTIAGTFTGNYLENEEQQNAALEITEGEFKVFRLR